MATNFLFDIRDHQFIFHEWLDTQKVLSCDTFRDYFAIEDIDSYLNLGLKMAREVVAPANDDADKIGARFEAGKVITPPSFKPAYQAVMEAGLGPQFADRESEGRMPLVLMGAINEMLSSACSSLLHYWGLTAGAARIIQDYGDEKSKQLFLPNMFSGKWGGTMNLTEPGAGSDVGDLLTKAYPTDKPGIYKIKGSKQFITCGDNDIVENLIHLVLARIDGCRPGTSGISLLSYQNFGLMMMAQSASLMMFKPSALNTRWDTGDLPPVPYHMGKTMPAMAFCWVTRPEMTARPRAWRRC
jgi:alkylation response protein AidB-like acyl-CoA dehydrogenase